MPRYNRIVKPEVVRLELSEGDWIEIKRRLSVGEQKRIEAAGLRRMEPHGSGAEAKPLFDLDTDAMSFARAETYLVDWSFAEMDGEGKVVPIPLTGETIRALDQETFAEMDAAIDRHVDAMAAEKKGLAGKERFGATSRS